MGSDSADAEPTGEVTESGRADGVGASSVEDAAPALPATPAGFRRRWGIVLGVGASVFVLDQLSKWWAVDELSDRTIDLVWTLRFALVENRGAAFSLFGGGGKGPIISLLVVGVVVFLLVQVRSMRSTAGFVAVGLILGGALGNLSDRLLRSGDGFLHGAVIDFIDLQWYPVFNMADMAVVCGAFLLAWVSLRSSSANDDDEGGSATSPAAEESA